MEFPNDPVDQSSIIFDYKEALEAVKSDPLDKAREIENIEQFDTNEDYNTGTNEKNLNENMNNNINFKFKKGDTQLKDISEISQNSNFIIRNSIQNSIFNVNENFETDRMEEEFEENTLENELNLNVNLNAKLILNEILFTKEDEDKLLGDIFFHVRTNKLRNFI